MMMVTTMEIAGREIDQTLGLVMANTVRARNVGRDIAAGLKSLVGGEVRTYTGLLREAREQVLAELETEAKALGADAVVGLRLMSSDVAANMAEVYAYGTAVKLK